MIIKGKEKNDDIVRLAYAAYVGYQLRAMFPKKEIDRYDDFFNNISSMIKIGTKAKEYEIKMDGALYSTQDFYEDGYIEAVKMLEVMEKMLKGDPLWDT